VSADGLTATVDRLRIALQAGDVQAAAELLAEDIVFHSPVTFHPFIGRETVTRLLGEVVQVFEGFRYVDELSSGSTHGLILRAHVGDREIEGLDLLRLNEQGLVADFTVMLRPLSALLPFAQAMAERVQAAGLQTTPQ
jgi:hypothetical protein